MAKKLNLFVIFVIFLLLAGFVSGFEPNFSKIGEFTNVTFNDTIDLNNSENFTNITCKNCTLDLNITNVITFNDTIDLNNSENFTNITCKNCTLDLNITNVTFNDTIDLNNSENFTNTTCKNCTLDLNITNVTCENCTLDLLNETLNKTEPREEESDSFQKVYIYGVGKLIATKKNDDGLIYHNQDSIGSNKISTNSNGEVISENVAYSYGSDFVSVGTKEGMDNKLKFTGQQQDNDDLYYYGARYYKPGMGRFLSVDPAGSPASYDYALNNPFKYIDPDGKEIRYAMDSRVVEFQDLPEDFRNGINDLRATESGSKLYNKLDSDKDNVFLINFLNRDGEGGLYIHNGGILDGKHVSQLVIDNELFADDLNPAVEDGLKRIADNLDAVPMLSNIDKYLGSTLIFHEAAHAYITHYDEGGDSNIFKFLTGTNVVYHKNGESVKDVEAQHRAIMYGVNYEAEYNGPVDPLEKLFNDQLKKFK